MSLFEFLMVLVSLIIGLGIAELLTGVARIIRNHQQVRLYWVHSVFVAILFLALLQTWWEIWELRAVPSWTFGGLLMMLGGPIGLFIISHLVFPEPVSGSDLNAYYFENKKPIFFIAIMTVAVSATFRPVVVGSELLALDNLSSFMMLVVFFGMAMLRNATFHGFMSVLIIVALVADILLVNLEIQ